MKHFNNRYFCKNIHRYFAGISDISIKSNYRYFDPCMEVYIGDIRVKSKRVIEHVDHIRKSFERMRYHQLKLNPLKCVFGVRVGNFLGFLVHQRWIEMDKNKAKAIALVNAPQNKKELQKFLSWVNYLRRFIFNLTGKTNEFFDLVKLKDMEEFRWEDRIKKHLTR